jgi:hypothetical protein
VLADPDDELDDDEEPPLDGELPPVIRVRVWPVPSTTRPTGPELEEPELPDERPPVTPETAPDAPLVTELTSPHASFCSCERAEMGSVVQ